MKMAEIEKIQVLYWDKDVTLKNVDEFRTALRKLLDTEADRLILDLQHVAYLNSAALGVIADGVLLARAHQKQLAISGIEPTVNEIFEIVKFGTFIKLFTRCEEAVNFLNSARG